MPSASRICASTKWPIRHFAMTGMVTAAMIDLISSGSDMRATPPSLRMSAGTRSSAITAHAPASCAMRACSGVTTSMITPPFSIWASPALTLKDTFTEPSPLRAPLRSATFEILRGRLRPHPRLRRYFPAGGKSLLLEPFQHQRPLGRVLGVGKQAVPVQAGQHVHLLEDVQQGRHGAPRKVGVGGGAGLLAARVELADEEQSLDRGEGNAELADRAVALLRVQVQNDPVPVTLQRAVEMAAQNLAVEEADRHLARGRVGELLVALKLDPLDRGQRDPGGFVVLQAAGIVDLDQEVRLVEIEIASDPFHGLVVEKADDYPGHLIPTVLTLIELHSCAGLGAFSGRVGGHTWYTRRCGFARLLPVGGGAFPRGRARAAAAPPRG